jgi:hypothetical protein
VLLKRPARDNYFSTLAFETVMTENDSNVSTKQVWWLYHVWMVAIGQYYGMAVSLYHVLDKHRSFVCM